MTASSSTWRILCATLLAGVAGVHLQQWGAVLRHVPVINRLFLIDIAAGAVLAIALLTVRRRAVVAMLAGTYAIFTLGAFLIARYGSLFRYQEPSWRLPTIVSAAFEVAAAAASVGLGFATRRVDAARVPIEFPWPKRLRHQAAQPGRDASPKIAIPTPSTSDLNRPGIRGGSIPWK